MPPPADQQKSTEGSQPGRKPGGRRREGPSLMQQILQGDGDSLLPLIEPPVESPAGSSKKRKKLTLIESYIRYGEATPDVCGRPRKSTAPGTVMAVPPSQRPSRPFLVPSIEGQDAGSSNNNANDDAHDDSDESLFVRDDTPAQRVRLCTPREKTPPGFQPDRELASKDTPFDQLYFPAQLSLQFKAEVHKWNERPRSERILFVMNHLVDGDILDQRVYESLNDANADVLEIMTKGHPEIFALPKDAGRPEGMGMIVNENAATQPETGVSIKIEEPEAALSMLQWFDPNIGNNNGQGVQSPTGRDVQSEAQPNASPSPGYLYWGQWKFVSQCLKMEARMFDGTQIKIFTSLKHLRTARDV